MSASRTLAGIVLVALAAPAKANPGDAPTRQEIVGAELALIGINFGADGADRPDRFDLVIGVMLRAARHR